MPNVEGLDVSTVVSITTVTISLEAQTAYALYYEIDRLLAAAGVHGMQSRSKVESPIIYSIYDRLYATGVIDAG